MNAMAMFQQLLVVPRPFSILATYAQGTRLSKDNILSWGVPNWESAPLVIAEDRVRNSTLRQSKLDECAVLNRHRISERCKVRTCRRREGTDAAVS